MEKKNFSTIVTVILNKRHKILEKEHKNCCAQFKAHHIYALYECWKLPILREKGTGSEVF